MEPCCIQDHATCIDEAGLYFVTGLGCICDGRRERQRSKAGNPAKGFRHMTAPTVGPGIKSTGAQMRLQHAKG